MGKENVCPCPNLECPNHNNCSNCNSRHLRKGTLNYCGFYAILPFLNEVSKLPEESEASKKVKHLIDNQSNAYCKLMDEHCISEDRQAELRVNKAKFSNY